MGISPSTFRAVVECVIPIPMLRSFEPSSRWPPVLLHVVTPSGLPRAKLLRCPLPEVCRCDLRLCWANGHRGSCFQHHQEPWQLRDVRASEAVSVLRVETTFFHPTPMVDQRFPLEMAITWRSHIPFWDSHHHHHPSHHNHILPHKNLAILGPSRWGCYKEQRPRFPPDFIGRMFGNTLPPALGVVPNIRR